MPNWTGYIAVIAGIDSHLQPHPRLAYFDLLLSADCLPATRVLMVVVAIQHLSVAVVLAWGGIGWMEVFVVGLMASLCLLSQLRAMAVLWEDLQLWS